MKLLVDGTPLSVGGGIQVAIAFLINLQRRDDIEWRAVMPEIVAAHLPAEIRDDRRVSFLRKHSNFDRLVLRGQLLTIERSFEPDVVFTIFGPAYFRARAPHLVGFALPTLIYEPDGPLARHSLLQDFKNQLQRFMFRFPDHIVVETETVRTRLSRYLSIDLNKISVIGNAINPVMLRQKTVTDVPDGRFGFLIPSTYYLHKNLEIVPKVAAAMQRIDPDLDFEFRFTLERSSSHWHHIEAQASALGAEKHLTTLGVLSLSDLADAYLAASAVFLPTLREASSAVYPESFYFKRPLATTDLDFAQELCGKAAMFLPPLDAEAMARGLVELAHSHALRARLVETGTAQLATNFPLAADKFTMQVDLLRELAQKHQNR